jgi:hypothetical protein
MKSDLRDASPDLASSPHDGRRSVSIGPAGATLKLTNFLQFADKFLQTADKPLKSSGLYPNRRG